MHWFQAKSTGNNSLYPKGIGVCCQSPNQSPSVQALLLRWHPHFSPLFRPLSDCEERGWAETVLAHSLEHLNSNTEHMKSAADWPLLQNHLNSSPNSTYHLSISEHSSTLFIAPSSASGDCGGSGSSCSAEENLLEVREKYRLVVDLPLCKIWKSVGIVGIIIPNIWKVIKFMCQTTNQNMYAGWLL